MVRAEACYGDRVSLRSPWSESQRNKNAHVVTLAGAHFIHDLFTAFLAPLLPLLIGKLGLSLVQAGSLRVVTDLPSLANAVLGAWIDRGRMLRVLVSITPGVTGLCMCFIGLAPSYATLVILLFACGVSQALLHVSVPVLIAQVATNRVGRGMSFFMVGGELARTVGPLVAVQAVSFLSLEGLWQVAPVALAASWLLWRRMTRPADTLDARRSLRRSGALVNLFRVCCRMRAVIVPVFGVMAARGFMATGLCHYLPTMIHQEGRSLLAANVSLFLLELGGAAGALIAGTLSDRLGRRWVLLGAVATAPPLMFLFLHASGVWTLLVLVALGMASLASTPVLMAIMIESAGADRAAANGTFLMLNSVVRSGTVLCVGAMGDALGLRLAYLLCAAIASLGIPFVFLIPRRHERLRD